MKAGESVRFSGTAPPDHDERTVLIQRRTRTKRWRTVARGVLEDAGKEISNFSVGVHVPSYGIYRARVAHRIDHLPGTSRPKPVSVSGD